MNKASGKYGIVWKGLIYVWSVYLNVMGKMNPSWKTLKDIIQENFPNLARQSNIQIQQYREHHKDIPQEVQPQDT